MEEQIKKVAETPAVMLDNSIKQSERFMKNKYIKHATTYWETLGPGLTTGASDDDPSGIATYSQTGAQYGVQLLWLAGFTFPLMAVVQEMCARIGLITGYGLAASIRKHYSRPVLYTCTILLFAANTFNLGADLGAMATATQLLLPQMSFFVLLIIFTVASLLLQTFTTYTQYAKYLKFLVFVLFAYILSAFSIKTLDWGNIIKHAVIPSLTFSRDQIILVCGILGTTISPYLFFWQTSQEVEDHLSLKGAEHIHEHHQGIHDEKTLKKEIKNMRGDVWLGMFISNLVMFFIIVATAATLFTHGITNIATASDAAKALRPIAGNQAYLLFAIGIIGAGLLAVPVLAGSASYAISESLRWKSGLYRKLHDAPAFYGIIIISMLIGFAINFLGIDPIKALIYSAVLNGLIAPLILFLIVRMSSNKKIMGDHTNHPFISLLGWLITSIMAIAGVATIISLFI